MKKANTLLVVALILFCQLSSHAQVKRQYQDDSFAETTVVIKENTETSDLDVLHEYFDIDEVGIGQVFRLTTEQVSSKSPQDPVQKEEPVAVAAVVPNPAPAPPVQQMAAPPAPAPKQVTGVVNAAPQRRVRSSGGIYPVKSYSYSGNFSRKRTKKTNKKNTKKKGNRCYRF